MTKLTALLSALVFCSIIPLTASAATSAFQKYEAARPPTYAQCKAQYGLPSVRSDENQYISQSTCCEFVNTIKPGACKTSTNTSPSTSTTSPANSNGTGLLNNLLNNNNGTGTVPACYNKDPRTPGCGYNP